MTSYYLVRDETGLFYIRRRILGVFDGFLSNSDIKPYWWSQTYIHHASFFTEQDAIAHWERAKQYRVSRQFTNLCKLS